MTQLQIEIVDCPSKIIAKCRVFIDFKSALELYSCDSGKTYEDKFFDRVEESGVAHYGKSGIFHRQRFDASGELIEQVRQKSQTFSGHGHLYLQTDVRNTDWEFSDKDCFLKVKFKRFLPRGKAQEQIDDVTFTTVLDRVISEDDKPIYHVLSMGCGFAKQHTDDFLENVHQSAVTIMSKFLLDHHIPNLCIPTKFMHMLRLSENCDLYENTFKHSCSDINHSIEETVNKFLDAVTQNDNEKPAAWKEYVWTTSYAQENFDFCRSMGMDIKSTMACLSDEWREIREDESISFGRVVD